MALQKRPGHRPPLHRSSFRSEPPGEALPDAEIICRFAQKMGYQGFDYTNAGEIYDEHCRLTAGTRIDISGLSYKILQEQRSIQWPYKNGQGTARLFTDHLSDRNRQAKPCPTRRSSAALRKKWATRDLIILTRARFMMNIAG